MADQPDNDLIERYLFFFAAIAPLLAMIDDLVASGWDRDRLTLILPNDVLPGVTRAYDLTVVRADVKVPMVGVAPDPSEAPRG